MKNVYLILLFLIPIFLNAQIGGGIRGRVVVKGSYTGNEFNSSDSAINVDSVRIVLYSDSSKDSLFLLSDAKGEFDTKHISPGIYVLLLEKPGYTPTVYRGVIISEMKTTYFSHPPIELAPIGSKEPKAKKAPRSKKQTNRHKKKHYW